MSIGMKTSFTKIERTAGLFVAIALVGCLLAGAVVAIKQGWFEPRDEFTTRFEHGEGIHPGTIVQMSGIRVGSVDEVNLTDDNQIEVKIRVAHSYSKKIKNDSTARVIRPFIIGDKVVDIVVGSREAPRLPDKAMLKSEDTMDIMDLLGGGKIGPYLTTIQHLLDNLKVVAEAFSDPERSKAIIGMFDEMLPTLKVVQNLGKQLTHKQNVGRAVANLADLTDEVTAMLPELRKMSSQIPEFGENTIKTMAQLQKLTEELNKFVPILTEISPQLPKATERGVEALEEAVIVLKAMQKSFLLSGKVDDVKREEAEKAKNKEKNRMPANETK